MNNKKLKSVISDNPDQFRKYERISKQDNRRSMHMMNNYRSHDKELSDLKIKVDIIETQLTILTNDIQKIVANVQDDEGLLEKSNEKIEEMIKAKDKLTNIRELLDVELNLVIKKTRSFNSDHGLNVKEGDEFGYLKLLYNSVNEQVSELYKLDTQSNRSAFDLEIRVKELEDRGDLKTMDVNEKKRCNLI